MSIGAAVTSDPFWADCEGWNRDRLRALQLEKLREQVARLGADEGFYARRFKEAGFALDALRCLEDLARLPVTRKQDYVGSVLANPPFGAFMATSQDQVRRIHFSSGTTAKPTPQFWTQPDLDRWADLYARYAWSQGVRPGDIFQCLFGYTWFVGGLGATAGLQKLGATCIPTGNQDTERQIATLMDFGSTVLFGTPSFIVHLGNEMLRRGLDPRNSKVRVIAVGGEPGASVPATRRRIETIWGAKCFDAYGCLEFQPIAAECSAQDGLHLMEDFVYAEVVDPETGGAVEDGQPGVLVVSHLDKQAGPLLRWWTGDMVLRDSRPCVCGRTHARLIGGVRGRADDMLVVRGVNVFPSAVEDVVRAIPGVSDEYRIVLDDSTRDAQTGLLNGIRLQVETADMDWAVDIKESTEAAIKARLQIRARVDVLPVGTLEPSTHKSKRVIRL